MKCTDRLRRLAAASMLIAAAVASATTTYVVSNTGSGGPGSFTAAVQLANANPGRDRIEFAPGLAGSIFVLAPAISDPVDIVGPGADHVTLVMAFNFSVLADVAVSGLTLQSNDRAFGTTVTTLDGADNVVFEDCVFLTQAWRSVPPDPETMSPYDVVRSETWGT